MARLLGHGSHFLRSWSLRKSRYGSDRLGRSLQDLTLDTTTPAGKAMLQMMGGFAEFERAIIQERVRAGLARARDEGTPIAPALEERIREARRLLGSLAYGPFTQIGCMHSVRG